MKSIVLEPKAPMNGPVIGPTLSFGSTQFSRETLAQQYPKYYKSVEGMKEVDVYAVHKIFEVNDPSGAIQHASKKLLLSGVRTGGKSKRKDIEEARDALNRWLQLNPED